ncbi:AfsR/SARP family transcriptional regulator [Pseudonocardia parietis]|uniref:DNA-binding SARP family transcriptional activator n=1 Tax=Pseudonocardia parietis TaxID=570936 RepID=A0ABS4W4D9_9PSEU|nr:AfsR/SARP family transcriptional regulator [Pseudonocardia parietis]MBP2371046.1 DNA-binding SARP family transcriptional activator [Pseudonocardia parietis]
MTRRPPTVAGIDVLGPVTARDSGGATIDLRGPRHKAVLARLIVARGRVVPLTRLVDDLWQDLPLPRNPAGAVRTFVSALRADLEPGRPAGDPARLIVTEGPGYAFRAGPGLLDADRFVAALDRAEPPGAPGAGQAVRSLHEALALWRGPAYADFPDASWVRAERARLGQLRLDAVERLGEARLAAGRPADAVPDLDAHVVDHPWREEGWRLLALALYRCERAGDALAVLRRARRELVDQLGSDPGPRLSELETDILRRAPHLDRSPAGSTTGAGDVLTETAAAWATGPAMGPRAGLTSATTLLGSFAVHGGGPAEATVRHASTIAAAEELGDPRFTAAVISAFDVPSVWTRPDSPDSSRAVVAAAERTLRALGDGAPVPTRVRLLTTIARESRGTTDPRGGEAAIEAERLARGHGDPALLATALGGRFLHRFGRAGLAARRDELGAEILDLGVRHELTNSTVLGHLVRLQARCALGDLAGAGQHEDALVELDRRHERPLVQVFVAWFRALRADLRDDPHAEAGYRDAAGLLDGAGMPGLADGLLPLALVARRLRRGESAGSPEPAGPYEPWIAPHRLLAAGERSRAAAALRSLPDPAPGHLLEVLWCLAGQAGLAVGDHDIVVRAAHALGPAEGELAGAGTGLLCAGPVAEHLDALRAAAA